MYVFPAGHYPIRRRKFLCKELSSKSQESREKFGNYFLKIILHALTEKHRVSNFKLDPSIIESNALSSSVKQQPRNFIFAPIGVKRKKNPQSAFITAWKKTIHMHSYGNKKANLPRARGRKKRAEECKNKGEFERKKGMVKKKKGGENCKKGKQQQQCTSIS